MKKDRLEIWLILAVVAMLMGAVTGAAYFQIGGIWAAISDTFGMLIGLSLIPVALGMHEHLKQANPGLSLRIRTIGVAGHGIFAASGLALVSYFMTAAVDEPSSFGQAAFGFQLLGICIEGVWWILLAGLSSQADFKRRIVMSAYGAGASNILFVLGTVLRQGILAAGGGFLGLVGFIAWAILLWLQLHRRKN